MGEPDPNHVIGSGLEFKAPVLRNTDWAFWLIKPRGRL